MGDKGIETIDADGIALAAIQGLHQLFQQSLQQKDAEISQAQQRLAKTQRQLAGQQQQINDLQTELNELKSVRAELKRLNDLRSANTRLANEFKQLRSRFDAFSQLGNKKVSG